VGKAHQTSAKYPDGISEFEAVGLQPEWLAGFAAPFVQESTVKYAMALRRIVPIDLNDTYLVIGEVQWVMVNKDLVQADGFIDLHAAGSLCSNGVDSYYSTHPLVRLPYAKP
jgi:flavin reductase (DIM6/NTAB) family NADH-FMN oxidoreductase RutF